MKRNPVVLFLAILATISGYLMSKASWVGRIGMGIFYKQYTFLKVWWQGAFVMFIAYMLLLTVHGIVSHRCKRSTAIIVDVTALVVAVVGLYLTYHDFRHNFSHRLMGERFHLGVYLFWVGWMIVCIYYLQTKRLEAPPTIADNTDVADL